MTKIHYYSLGYNAACNKIFITANPYKVNSLAFNEWMRGYDDFLETTNKPPTYSEIFTQFILGQKVTGMGWMSLEYPDFIGGYYIEYENGYKTVTHGGGFGGRVIVTMKILNEKGEVLEFFEEQNF